MRRVGITGALAGLNVRQCPAFASDAVAKHGRTHIDAGMISGRILV